MPKISNAKVKGYQGVIESLFEKAGVTINGPKEYDITIKNEHFYQLQILVADFAGEAV